MKKILFDSLVLGYLSTALYFSFISLNAEQALNLAVNFAIFLGFCILGAIISYLTAVFGIRTLGDVIFAPAHKKLMASSHPWYRTFWGLELFFLFTVTFVLGLEQTHFSLRELFDESGLLGAGRLFAGIFSPNFEILPVAVLAIIETIFIAFMATTFAVPVAFVLSFFCAKNIMAKSHTGFSIYLALRTFLNVTRSVEALIWAIVFSVWVGIGPFAGMLALMLHSMASLAKQYSEIVECVDDGPLEGVASTGANHFQVVWFAVVPQIVLPYISFTIYRWDINVRMATIIGLVGGGGIGSLLIQYQGRAMWNEVGCIVVVIAAAVWMMDTASAYIREAIK